MLITIAQLISWRVTQPMQSYVDKSYLIITEDGLTIKIFKWSLALANIGKYFLTHSVVI